MAGFIRRFNYFPGAETIGLIEGVVIVDLPPPSAVAGSGVGTVAVVGEFADMTYGVAVDPTDGSVTTSPRPVEVTSGQDLLDKVGGWDETLGDFAAGGGNGYVAIRNKKFSRLVLVPVNLASSKGTRLWRDLPTNKAAANPVPVVPVSAGVVLAGREFLAAGKRLRTCAKVTFTALGAFKQGTDGVTLADPAGVVQNITSAAGAFTTPVNGRKVEVGDILVVGVIGAAGAQGTNARTYRVNAVTSATALAVTKMDETSFTWAAGTGLAWRIHPNTDADTATSLVGAIDEAAGCLIPARPLDQTIAATTICAPTVVPPAATAKSWDHLSGLTLVTHPSTGLVYTAAIQAPNAVNVAGIDALYSAAIDGLLTEQSPGRDVNILVTARHDSTIRAAGKAHALEAASQGVGRVFITAPELTTDTVDDATAASDPGVGSTRDERVFYSWPAALTSIPEAVGYVIPTADGKTTTDGILDVHADAWLASVLSNLPPERNPGQATAPVPQVLAPVLGLARNIPAMQMADYMRLKAGGICGLRIDRSSGPIFQSGITTSLTSGLKNINRRRMADFLEDSLAQRFVSFAKLPLTLSLQDAITGETDAFLDSLLSPNNPAAQRISGYLVDDKSGNTPDLTAKGIYVVIAKVKLTPTADQIVLQVEAGESVTVTAQ